MRSLVISSIFLASLFSIATAQFGFFNHMFGDQSQGQQHRQQQPSPDSQWTAHAEAVSCSSYLCPDSLVCVARPSECPCPRQEDIKCVVPDSDDADAGTVVCTRGSSAFYVIKVGVGTKLSSVNMAAPRPTSKLPPGANRILFVKNLNYQITGEDLYDLFGRYGSIRQIRMGNESKTKGTAFVVFDDVMDAKNALDHLNGFHLQERYIVVLYHMPAKQDAAAAKADLARREEELSQLKKKHNIGDD